MIDLRIEQVTGDLAEQICRDISANLPEYFGLPEVNEHYAQGVRSRIAFAAIVNQQYVGLISIEFPYPENANIYWLGVLQNFHSKGIGRNLITEALKFLTKNKIKTISVETLSPIEGDKNYLKTYHFYQSIGFLPLFDLKPQGYEWNMVYMVKFI